MCVCCSFCATTGCVESFWWWLWAVMKNCSEWNAVLCYITLTTDCLVLPSVYFFGAGLYSVCVCLWLQRCREGEEDATDSQRPPEHAARGKDGATDPSPEEMMTATAQKTPNIAFCVWYHVYKGCYKLQGEKTRECRKLVACWKDMRKLVI